MKQAPFEYLPLDGTGGFNQNKTYKEPCGQHNQISYEAFCQLGGVRNPKLAKIYRQNGSYQYTTYHLRSY